LFPFQLLVNTYGVPNY